MDRKRTISAKLKDLSAHLKYFPWELGLYLRGHGPCFRIYSHLTLDEKLLLYSLAKKLSPNSVIVEIGSYLGASTTFLAAGAKENSSQVYCVDTWKNDAMSEGPRDTFDEFISNTDLYRKLIVPIRGKSVDVGREFDKPIDMLFLDGDHSYEACRVDVETWLPKVKPGGSILLHDYGWSEGVRQVVKKFVKPNEDSPGDGLSNMYCTHKKGGQ